MSQKACRVLVVGDFLSLIHEEALSSAFEKLGHVVYRFKFSDFLFPDKDIFHRVQNKLKNGPTINHMNLKLISQVEEFNPDLIFYYRPSFIFPKTFKFIQQKKYIQFIYNNDNPFSNKHGLYFWRRFFCCLPYCNWIFAYRPSNMESYKKIGYTNCSLLRSYYINAINYRMSDISEKVYDVVFVGHYEPDERVEYIRYLLDHGVKVSVYGPEWEKCSEMTRKLGPISTALKDYNKILNQSKIALVFYSKLNQDSYTRRCFEIPATGTLMMTPYSDDIVSLFRQEKDSVFFSTKEDLLDKVQYYLQNEAARNQIADSGYNHLVINHHEVTDRAQEVIDRYSSFVSK